jgi:hypothetical protein
MLQHFCPTPHATVTVRSPDGRKRAEVDLLIAPLIEALWAANVPTLLSCQNRSGSGLAWVRVRDVAAARNLYALAAALDPAAKFGQHSPSTSPHTADVSFPWFVLADLTRLVRLNTQNA